MQTCKQTGAAEEARGRGGGPQRETASNQRTKQRQRKCVDVCSSNFPDSFALECFVVHFVTCDDCIFVGLLTHFSEKDSRLHVEKADGLEASEGGAETAGT